MLQGTKGTLFIDRAGYEITPQMRMHREAVSQTDREAYDDLLGVGDCTSLRKARPRRAPRRCSTCRTCAIFWIA